VFDGLGNQSPIQARNQAQFIWFFSPPGLLGGIKMVNWGILKDGKIYNITVMSLDIVGNSRLVKKYGTKIMEKVYFRLRSFVVGY